MVMLPAPADIAQLIPEVRGVRMLLDEDLAPFYEVEVRAINQAVKRNKERFPEDFMFHLSREEHDGLRSQSVTLNTKHKGKYNNMKGETARSLTLALRPPVDPYVVTGQSPATTPRLNTASFFAVMHVFSNAAF